MSKPACVVYDLDGTLVHGDVGHAFIKQLLTDTWYRMLLAAIVTPLLIPMMKTVRWRRLGISGFLWVASVGRASRIPGMASACAASYPMRVLPAATARLRADLERGETVVVATGALDLLAMALLARLDLPRQPILVASTIRPAFGGYVISRQCNGEAKVRALADDGYPTPFDCAYSDALIDWPLLAAARSPILVSDDANTIAAMRARIGAHLEVIAP